MCVCFPLNFVFAAVPLRLCSDDLERWLLAEGGQREGQVLCHEIRRVLIEQKKYINMHP